MSNSAGCAIIIGASRGLGLGLVRACLQKGWSVVATLRSPDNPEISRLSERHPGKLRIEQCDIADEAQIAALGSKLAGTTADLLFVNAGISNGPDEIVEAVPPEALSHLVVTNALGPLKVIDTLAMIIASDGVVAVMSSNLASITNNTTGYWEGYRASKAALNTLLRSYAARHESSGVTYLAISPGWVKTDMGGDDAPLEIETSVDGMLRTIESRRGTSGVAFVNYLNEIVPW